MPDLPRRWLARSTPRWPISAFPARIFILLDQWLGVVNALPLLPRLRRHCAAPIVFLSGTHCETDRVAGLELGADDYLVKPISVRELVARVRAHLRRRDPAVPPTRVATPDAATPPTSSVGAWRIDRQECRVYRPDGSVVPLSLIEFNLLACLAAQPGVAMDRMALSHRVLGRDYWTQDRALDNLVHRIRRKFGDLGHDELIGAERNRGYVFRGFPK